MPSSALPFASVLALVLPPGAQDFQLGDPSAGQTAANEVFGYAAAIGNVTNEMGTFTAGAAAATCIAPQAAYNTQFATARAFVGPNGFAVSNAYVENLDDDGVAVDVGCAFASGGMGGLLTCTGGDALLSSLLAGSPTLSDAAVAAITFDVLAPTLLDISYNLVTFESPGDGTFFDAFGIVYDDGVLGPALIAGGRTNGGPELGTDPWTLTPSSALPSEYQSVPPNGSHNLPAHHTRRRRVWLFLPPGNGQKLSFHVADSGPTVVDPCGTGVDSTCAWVASLLMVGLESYSSADPRGWTRGTRIGSLGHPTGTGPFAPDFQIQATGFRPGEQLVLIQGVNPLAPFGGGVIEPLQVLVSPPYGLAFVTTDTSGEALHPATPAPIPPGVVGDFFFQWWGLHSAGRPLYNSRGLRVVF